MWLNKGCSGLLGGNCEWRLNELLIYNKSPKESLLSARHTFHLTMPKISLTAGGGTNNYNYDYICVCKAVMTTRKK